MAFRIDNASSTATYTPGARLAGPNPGNYFTDPVGPTPGTIWDADFANMLQEEVCGCVEGAGLTLSKTNDAQLWAAVGGGAAAKSHATTTGSVTTNHPHGVFASITSTASGGAGQVSAVIAGENTVASGNYAVGVGAPGCNLSGAYSGGFASANCDVTSEGGFVIGCSNVDVSALTGGSAASTDSFMTSGGLLLASYNAELAGSAYQVAGGYAAAGISKTSANQNLTWMLDGQYGHGYFAGSVYVGGDVDAGSGDTIELRGSSGAIYCVDVSASGNIDCDTTVTATTGLILPSGTNKPSHYYTENLGSDFTAGTSRDFTIANTNIAGGSALVYASNLTPGEDLAVVRVTPSSNQVIIRLHNLGSTITSGNDVTVGYTVFNTP